jgi:predicted RNA-binding protein with TRAM domain
MIIAYISSKMGYGGREDRRSGLAKPVEVDKEYEVNITEISRQGDGVARIQGFIVFVENGKTLADNVKIKVTYVGDRFAKAVLA